MRDCGKGICREMGACQGGCQSGILHPHFNGHCFALGHVQLQNLSNGKTQPITTQIVQNHHHHDQKPAGHDPG